jgi:hypothetical protein
MNGSSHPNHENHKNFIYRRAPRLMAFPRHGGARRLFAFTFPVTANGASLFGAGVFIMIMLKPLSDTI